MSHPISNPINNQVALVTGANRGIGKAIVESLLARGAAKVYLGVRSAEKAQALIADHGDRVQAVVVDFSRPETISALGKSAADATIVINNAGVLEPAGPLDDHVETAFQHELEVNTFGLLRMARTLAPVLAANGGGALVQLNSVASLKNFSAFATYSASKAASYSITQSLREILKDQGIRVLSVHPGPIDTDMGDKAGFAGVAEPPSVVAEAVADAIESGQFHLFPDTMAKQFESGYAAFARDFIEAEG